MQPTPGVSTGRRPPPTRFTDVKDEDWSPDDWRDAKAAIALFPEGRARNLLNYIYSEEMIPEFKEQYKAFWNALSVDGLSPVDYYKHCIEKKKKRNVINVKCSTFQFVASTATVEAHTDRRIFTEKEEGSLWTMEPLAAAFVAEANNHTLLPSDVNQDQVYVVSGESGIGKTTYGLMTAEFGICLTSQDIQVTGLELSSLSSLSAEGRNQLVFAAVERAIKQILGELFEEQHAGLKGKDPVTTSLVLDEFGQYPAFVRGLCAVQGDVRALLRDIIPFDVNVNILVIGTGTDIKSDGIGCQPEKCSALRISDTPMLDRMKTALTNRYGNVRAATLISALECHGQAQHLICNPRFAACLFKRIVGFCGPPPKVGAFLLFNSKEAALVALDMLLVVSAQDYKLLNAMKKLDQKNVAHFYKVALELLLRDVHDLTELTPDEISLLTSKGVLEDCSSWVEHAYLGQNSQFVAISGQQHDVMVNGLRVARVLAAPRTGRYKMSMAQQLLFRMSYGFHVLETAASWQRYEVQIAEHTTMLLSGFEGRPLHELLGRLGWPKRAKKSGAPSGKKTIGKGNKTQAKIVTLPEDRVLSFKTVTTIHSKGQIEPTTSREQFKKLFEKCVSNEENVAQMSNAVVIVNGSGAPYADVIVVIPKIAVILIQCKFYGDNSRIKIREENEKLKPEIDALKTFAGVPAGAYFRVLATTKTLGENVDLLGFHLLDTSDPTSLAPLFTPIHEPNVPADEEYKVVLSLTGTRVGPRAIEE